MIRSSLDEYVLLLFVYRSSSLVIVFGRHLIFDRVVHNFEDIRFVGYFLSIVSRVHMCRTMIRWENMLERVFPKNGKKDYDDIRVVVRNRFIQLSKHVSVNNGVFLYVRRAGGCFRIIN